MALTGSGSCRCCLRSVVRSADDVDDVVEGRRDPAEQSSFGIHYRSEELRRALSETGLDSFGRTVHGLRHGLGIHVFIGLETSSKKNTAVIPAVGDDVRCALMKIDNESDDIQASWKFVVLISTSLQTITARGWSVARADLKAYSYSSTIHAHRAARCVRRRLNSRQQCTDRGRYCACANRADDTD
jgi:hypothetical protein